MKRHSTLAILVTGQHWQAQFEWWAHEPMARDAGVPEDVIQAVKRGETPVFSDAGDAAAYAVAHELYNTRTLSQETFDTAVAALGETGVAEIIGVSGFYGLVSMTLNGFDVELPEGATPPFPA